MRIRTRILASFAIVVAFLVALGISAVSALGSASNNIDRAQARGVDPLVAIAKVQHDLDITTRNALLVLYGPADGKATATEDFQKSMERGTTGIAHLGKLDLAPTLEKDYQKVVTLTSASVKLTNTLFGLHMVPLDPHAPEVDLTHAAQILSARDKGIAELKAAFVTNVRSEFGSIHSSNESMKTTTTVVLIAAVLLALGIALYLADRIVKPLKRTVRVLEDVAEGDLTQRLDLSSKDEIGDMATALNRTLDRTAGVIRSIDVDAEELATAAAGFTTRNEQVSATAEHVAKEAENATANVDKVGQSINTVATATEEMTAAIGEIATNASEAATVAASAVEVGRRTRQAVEKLGDSSSEIGSVVSLIDSIAEQTNLLALNATIEAARAGESGKGFAVVANEVKQLAQETGRATADITARITAIQGDTRNAVEAIEEITEVIDRINEIQATIAAAVEEQTATTSEIGRNAVGVAESSTETVSRIAAVAQAIDEVSRAIADNRQDALRLADMSEELKRVVSQFRHDGAPAQG